MTDRSVADQTPSQHYAIEDPVNTLGHSRGSAFSRPVSNGTNRLNPEKMRRRMTKSNGAASFPYPYTSLKTQLKGLRDSREELSLGQRKREREVRQSEALRWLSENRAAYAGQWVALRGADLLAVGSTAKEVYDQVRSAQPPALVTWVKADDLPFAGWIDDARPASELSFEERLRRFNAWVNSRVDNTVVLPNEAMDRESIYGDHGS